MENGSTATCQSKEEKPMKATITIEASEWTQENLDSFVDWLNDQLLMANMGSGDDALVVDAQIEEEQNEQSV